ncbi:MAG: hypothetical protein JSW70_00225 [Syntrophobacterales bacterium]|nr:MAG: hypothetical protein JSW70_00225 [Syntrophobacterales bacterium]
MKHKSKDIVEMVKAGFTDKQIMKELGIQTKTSLKKMYFDALVEAGKIKAIITEREKKKKQRKTKVLTIGKRGTIVLSRLVLIDQLGFKVGEKFRVSKRRDSIILKRA